MTPMQAAVSLCRPGGQFGHMFTSIGTCEGLFLGGVVRTPEEDRALKFTKQSFKSADTSAAGRDKLATWSQRALTTSLEPDHLVCDLPALKQINLLHNNTASPL